jgi:5-formyltetrahydrofolate cyclo-ligase
VTAENDKTALRRRLRALRRSLAEAAPEAAWRAAEAAPIERLTPLRGAALYYAQGAELDPTPLAERLAAAGMTTALPAARARDGLLQFRAWRPGETLVPDAAGVPAPPDGAAVVTPGLLVAPLLGFDRRGGRLGQGGGHYDRTIANLRARGQVFVLGLAYAGQEVDALPLEPHDQRLDAILTEAGYIAVARD